MAAGRPKAPGAATKQTVGADHGKSLYQVKSRAGMSSHPSGLEELAEVVHSSGLGSGLLNKNKAHSLDYQNHRKTPVNNQKWIWIGLGIGGAALVLALLVLFFMRASAVPSTVIPVAPPAGLPVNNGGGAPMFGSIPLSGEKIVYVIDRGDATSEYIGTLRDMTIKSVKSLGGDRRFSVILWKNNTDDAYPAGSMAYANADEVNKLSNWFDEVSMGSSTSYESALMSAFKFDPDHVVLVTAKGLQLDSDTADKILKLRGTRKAAVDVISIAGPKTNDPLEPISKRTGGQFHAVSGGSELRAMNP